MPKTISVTDPSVAGSIYSLAADGFEGSVTDLTKKLGLGVLSPTDAGRFSAGLQDLAEVMEPLKVEIEFKRKGNNKLIRVGKCKGYKKAVPAFVRSEDVKPPKGASIGFDPSDARIIELNSEVVHLKSELNATRRAAAAATKDHGLFQAIVKELEPRIVPIKALPSQIQPKKAAIKEHVVLHISDAHADQIVTSAECGGLEEYNFPIACARAERLIDSALEYTQDTLSPKYQFTDLWFLSYGDMTSGEIHGHAERSYYQNMFTNCLAIGQLQALMIRDLAPYFDNVHVVCLSGNHGRRSLKKNYNAPTDNWDTLIAHVSRLHCQELDNVDFLIPEAYSVNLDINGHGFNVSHGDDVRSNGGIPWYGFVRRQKSLIALNSMRPGLPLRYFVMGHHHNQASLTDMNGELLVNGAWLGTDSYSYNSFSGYRDPCQLLHGVHERNGVTWRLPLKLKHDGEAQGPKRYKINLPGEDGRVQGKSNVVN